MFEVVGGQYTDFTFTKVVDGRGAYFGPFETYNDAYDAWKHNTWLNVDDGQYRLTIVDRNPPKAQNGYLYPFPGVSATATVVLLQRGAGPDADYRVLLGKRGDDADAYPGEWCLPGGFLNAATKGNSGELVSVAENTIVSKMQQNLQGETLEDAALREVREETNIVLDRDQLKVFYVHSDPKTDPRAHVVNVCYYAILDNKQVASAKAGDDLQEVKWHYLWEMHDKRLAFNHAELYEKFEANFKED